MPNGTRKTHSTSSVIRMMLIMTQLASSSVRETRRAAAAIRNTTTSSAIAQSRGSSASSGGSSAWTRAYSPSPAEAAQPPAMNANRMRNTEIGTHRNQPGGTRPQPTTGASPVATTYREHSML